MYLKRKVDLFLEEWKKSADRKPLIVRGARQIGKSESIRKFAHHQYEIVQEINFIEEKKYCGICDTGYSVDEIIKNISRLDPKKRFIPGKTLLFFDEIQEYPDIATALKFFKIDGRYDVICSGSLLGVNYRSIASVSVGYKTDYLMRSLDFEEFLWARGYGEDMIEDILEHMTAGKPFSDLELKLYHELFLDFCIIGGMPEIVRTYIANGTFEGILSLQRQLVEDYKGDIRKYSSGVDQTRIMNVLNRIPVQLARDNKKYQISKVARGARFQDYRGCIEWLADAGVINLCYCLNYPELPLKGNYKDEKYKIYFADTGLLIAMLDDEAQQDLRENKNLHSYKGGLFENIVSEALVKAGYELYYYKREQGTLEEDFFIRGGDDLVPVEVKANNGNAKSLKQLIKGEQYEDIRYGIKLIKGNVGKDNDIITFPYFCAFLLKRYMKKRISEL